MFAILANKGSFASVIDQIVDDNGRLDVLVNNAGMTRDGLMLRMSDEDFEAVINVNLEVGF